MSARGSGTLLAAFEAGDRALAVARELRELGYRRLDVHAAQPLPGAAEALGLERPRALPRLVLVSGLLGAGLAYLVQWYTNSVDYPLVVGGRPLHPWPAFVPITFEGGVLLAAVAAFGGLLVLARLGRLWQPVFEAPDFDRASVDLYWVAVAADDPLFDAERTRTELERFAPLRIAAVGEEP